MGNLSYCRYENTSNALRDCVDAIWESDCSETLSDYEIKGLNDLLIQAKNLIYMEDKIINILENQEYENK